MSEQLALGAVAALPAQTLDELEAWWLHYPRKVAKPAARRAWCTARRGFSFDALLDGLLRFEFPADPRFIPHAATWLNQRRWQDVRVDLRADPWGLCEWLAAQEAGAGMFSAAGYGYDACADVLAAAGLAAAWRGDLAVLAAWLADGYRPDSVAGVIAEVCAAMVGAPIGLAAFDRAVRRRALRWCLRRMEWVWPT